MVPRIRRAASAWCATSRICSTATRFTGPTWSGPGSAGNDRHDGGWQPELWRRLRERIAAPSPAERLSDACARIRREPTLLELPPRLSLFGLTRMPRSYLEVLAAIAADREVHLFVLHPSPVAVAAGRGRARGGPSDHRAGAPIAPARLPVNRLLASWGRDVRELQLVLRRHRRGGRPPSRSAAQPNRTRCWSGSRPTSAPTASRPACRSRASPIHGHVSSDDDRSIQVHACHGRARQVEVLRDAVLHLLADDPTLEPRDVIVMCPDIETFAPLIQATFGAGRRRRRRGRAGEIGGNRLPDLRVRLADRSLRQTNPVLGVVSQLLALADQRATASQLLDLAGARAGSPAVRLRRRRPVADAGLGRGERDPLGVRRRPPRAVQARHADRQHLARGVDRVLLGVAMTEEDLPLRQRRAAARRRRERRDRSGRALRGVRRPLCAPRSTRSRHSKPIHGWTEAIAGAADALTATSERDAWQRRELQRLLDGRRRASRGPGRRQPRDCSSSADVRALLGRPAAGPADPSELPHRPSHGLHARADAVGPAPGRLRPRARRRRVPARARGATATT